MIVTTTDITDGGPDPLVGHLLADLGEALAAYEELYGASGAGEARVLGVSAEGGARGAAGALSAGERVYAVVTTASRDAGAPAAREVADELGRACAGRGARWSGALLVGDAGWNLRWSRAPRMGWRRRAISEAVDRLIAAIRSGADFPAQTVRPPLPRRLGARTNGWPGRRGGGAG